MSDPIVVKTVEELKAAPEEYREAVAKLVISHAINELYGAQVFDEPAIAYAPTPYAKWLTCRVAMEEYGHHVRFKQLGVQMGIPEERMVPGSRQAAAVDLRVPAQDLGGVRRHQAAGRPGRDPAGRGPAALHLPSAAQPRAHHHAGGALPRAVRRGLHRRADQDAGRQGHAAGGDRRYFPYLPSFFGGSKSKNNEIFRKWNIKQRTNDEMRADFMKRATEVADKYDLTLPEVKQAA